MPHLVAGPHLHTEPIGPDDAPTTALFRALGRADVDDRPSDVLNDFVDPDALDAIFAGPRAKNGYGRVTFEAWNVVVTVTADEVSVYEAPDGSVDRGTGTDGVVARPADEREPP